MMTREACIVLLLAACGVNKTPEAEELPSLPQCTPNRDGKITADELPVALGQQATYYASPAGKTRAVDLKGDDTGWRLDTEYPDDEIVEIGPVVLATQWYAAKFPQGRFVVPAGGGLDGIYHQDDQALWLDGTASQDADKTILAYAQPVPLLRFPLQDGDHADVVAELPAGTVSGLPFIGSDTFAIDVTGRDHVLVPYVDFNPALRVRTTVTRQATGTPTKVVKHTTLFMFECFGEVARAESATDEPAPDFTSAAYLRRFALGATP